MPSLNTKLATAPNTSSNYVLKATTSTTIGNSLIFDNGNSVLVNLASITGYGTPKFVVKQSTANDYEGIIALSSSNDNSVTISHTGTIGRIASTYGSTGSYTSLAFATSQIDRLTITSSGNVGIGETPSSSIGWARILTLNGNNAGDTAYILKKTGSAQEIALGTDGAACYHDVAGASNATNNVHIFRTGGTNSSYSVTERMRLNSSQGLVMADGMQVLTTGGYYRLRTSAGATTGLFIQKNTWAGFGDASPTIAAETGYGISFFTNGNNTERMAITTGGNIIVGNQTNLGSAYQFSFKGVNGGIDAFAALAISNNGNNIINFFNASNSYVASITINASTITYGTGSDYRLKEDLKDFNGLEKVSLIKVYDFKFKEEGDRMEGVLAHELQEIIPYAVTGHKDEIDADGNPKIQNVDYSKIVPVLIKAIQEQQKQIDELKQLVK